MPLKFSAPPTYTMIAPTVTFSGMTDNELVTSTIDASSVARQSAVPVVQPNVQPSQRSSALFRLCDRIFGKVLAVDKSSFDILLRHMDSSTLPVNASWDDDDDYDEPDDPDYPIQDSIATLCIHGPLFKRDTFFSRFFGLSTYQSLRRQLSACLADTNVKGILLDVDSPGGEAAGMKDLCDYIYSIRGQKPIFACSNDSMYSAAYGIASSADTVYVTEDGGCGSIGCYVMHLDRSGMDEQFGLKYTYIFAGDKKVDGNPHEPLSDRAKATLQTEVNRVRDMFVSIVARNRNVSAESVAATQAGQFFAEACVPMLADRVASLTQCMEALMARCGVKAEDGENDDVDPDDGEFTTNMGKNQSESITLKSITLKSIKLNQPTSYYRQAYAWQKDPNEKDIASCSEFKFLHHEVSATGDIGAANIEACRSCLRAINGLDGTTIPGEDRSGVYEHLAKHLRDAGIEPPDFRSEAEYCEALLTWSEEKLASRFDMYGRVFSRLLCEAPQIAKATKIRTPHLSVRQFGSSSSTETAASASAHIVDIITVAHAMSEQGEQLVTKSTSEQHITMLVVPYNSASVDMGGFKELYSPGCFRDGLTHDPHALFNHDVGCILGRQSAGTAKFYETAAGVCCDVTVPDTTLARDLLVSMRRGDITQSSAAFWVLRAHWETRSGERFRIIDQALLREAAVQPFPAYEMASASVPQAQNTQVQQVQQPHADQPLADSAVEGVAVDVSQAVTQPEAQETDGSNSWHLDLAEARLRLLKLV